MQVILAQDHRGRVIFVQSANKLGLTEEQQSDVQAQLKTIAAATLEENRAARRFSDFHTVNKTTLQEVKYRGVNTEYRVIGLLKHWDGKPALVVGRIVAREALNKTRKKAEIAASSLGEIERFINSK